MTLKQQLEKLINDVQSEFDNHSVQTIWVYTLETRTLIIKISYPLSKEFLFVDCKVPKTKLKVFFEYMEIDLKEKINKFILESSKRYGYHLKD